MFIEVQNAIYKTLAAHTPLTDLLASYTDFAGDVLNFPDSAGDVLNFPAIYTDRPQHPEPESPSLFPYIEIGSDRFTPFDTDTSNGLDGEIQVLNFARDKNGVSSLRQSKVIMKHIYDAIHKQELTVNGSHFVLAFQSFAETIKEDDGKTTQGVQRFRIVTEQI